jgi:hypothetical protein
VVLFAIPAEVPADLPQGGGDKGKDKPTAEAPSLEEDDGGKGADEASPPHVVTLGDRVIEPGPPGVVSVISNDDVL